MSVALGCTWNPRGEMPRLKRYLSLFQESYSSISIVLPPPVAPDLREEVHGLHGVRVVDSPVWEYGRHLALRSALESSASHIQYADMDRLLRWVETRTEEWQSGVSAIEQRECLIFGRTEAAYETHPKALRETERIVNQVFSFLLGQEVDLSAGVKGFSRRAALFLLENSPLGRALGVDAEWPVILHQAGFSLEMMWVDGLDWETADRYQAYAADKFAQRLAAEKYDQNPASWERRIAVAQEILAAGLEAFQRNRRL